MSLLQSSLTLTISLLIIFGCMVLVGVGLTTSLFRTVKTLYLIATISPYEREIPGAPRILVLGDSTGYGTGADTKEDSIAGLIGRDYPQYSIQNNSKNGRTIGDLVPVVEQLGGNYELILLQIGGNDILQYRDVSAGEAELRTIVSLLSSHAQNILMMSSGNVGGAAAFSGTQKAIQYEKLTREFRNMFLHVAEDTALIYVDVFREPEVDIISQNPKEYLAFDGLHPSSAGYAVWYQSLAPVLQAQIGTK